MTENEFYELVSEALEVEVSELCSETVLSDLEEWDSIGQLSLIGLLDEQFGGSIDVDKLETCNTCADLRALIQS